MAEASLKSDAIIQNLKMDIRKLEAEKKRMKDYLQKVYEGDGNIEFDELEHALKGK